MSSDKETIDSLLLEYFPTSMFIIVPLQPNKTEYRYKISTVTNDCLLIQFWEDHIYIELVEGCGIKGGESLKIMEQIALRLDNINYIGLRDDSFFDIYPNVVPKTYIMVDLGVFKILTKGESWYNSLGYFSDNYKTELVHNEGIAKMKLLDFQENVKRLNIEELMKTHTVENYDNQLKLHKSQKPTQFVFEFLRRSYQNRISEIQSTIDNLDNVLQSHIDTFSEKYESNLRALVQLFPDIFLGETHETMTVKRFYNKIMELIHRDEPDPKKGDWLCESLGFIRHSNILNYDRHSLRKHIRGFNGGGFKKQKQKQKQKQRKTKRLIK